MFEDIHTPIPHDAPFCTDTATLMAVIQHRAQLIEEKLDRARAAGLVGVEIDGLTLLIAGMVGYQVDLRTGAAVPKPAGLLP